MTVRVAFGPSSSAPSWKWVGIDTAQELQKYFDVSTFGELTVPDADVVIVIKTPLSPGIMNAVRRRRGRVIYAPIDYFKKSRQIKSHAEFLCECEMVLLHSEALAAHFDGFAPLRIVDHHGKFVITPLLPYKDAGFALWIGAIEHLPYLLRYLERNHLSVPVKVLTNVNSGNGVCKALTLARKLGVEMRFGRSEVNGLEMFAWSASLQREMMLRAKAAIDIKGAGFGQRTKPPTKAQQYIGSGLPLAMNMSWSVEYFRRRGLAVPVPTEPRWLSREYHREVCDMARDLAPVLALETIGRQYKILIEEVLDGGVSGRSDECGSGKIRL